MVLLNQIKSLDIIKTVKSLRNNWGLTLEEPEPNKDTHVFMIGDQMVAIALIPAAIPGDEVKIAGQYNYFWPNAEVEACAHQGHLLVTIMNSGSDPVKSNILFAQIIAAVLENSDSIGVYIGSRSLVIKKDFYLENIKMMNDSNLPIYLWIYFGLREEKGKRSMYTYGLKEFKKEEIEILDTDMDFNAINELLVGVVQYVLRYDKELKHGETIGFTEDQKLNLIYSKARFLEGNSLKISIQ
jgi:hypothetical protein